MSCFRTEDLVLTSCDREGVMQLKRVKLFYFPGQLHFASAERFKRELMHKALSRAVERGLQLSSKNSDCSSKVTMNINYFFEDTSLPASPCPHSVRRESTKEERAGTSHHRDNLRSTCIDSGDEHIHIHSELPGYHTGIDSRRVSTCPSTPKAPSVYRKSIAQHAVDTRSVVFQEEDSNEDFAAAGSHFDVEDRKRSGSYANFLARDVDGDPTNTAGITTVIIDCSAMTYIDLVGVNTLQAVIAKFDHIGVRVYLVRCPDYMLTVLQHSGFFATVPRSRVVLDIHDVIKMADTTATSFSQRASLNTGAGL